MSPDLLSARRQVADAARDGFDFGDRLVSAQEWVEDLRDALTCRVQVSSRSAPRRLCFRVVFAPESDRLDHIAVAERLALS